MSENIKSPETQKPIETQEKPPKKEISLIPINRDNGNRAGTEWGDKGKALEEWARQVSQQGSGRSMNVKIRKEDTVPHRLLYMIFLFAGILIGFALFSLI